MAFPLSRHGAVLAGAMLAFSVAGTGAAAEGPDGSGPAMVTVPKGAFVFGSNDTDKEGRAREFGGRRPWYLDEHPRQTRALPAFRIDRTEVTERAYAIFVKELRYTYPPDWQDGHPDPAHLDDPVTQVTWMDAQNYCHWRGARLPSEFEWEKAARGSEGRRYPWGNTFVRERANVGQAGGIMPVGRFPLGASPYGALDMAGNVWEWTSSWYLPYPGNPAADPFYGHRFKVVRGGSAGVAGGHYLLEQLTTRASYRFQLDPRARADDVGFRCVQTLDGQGRPVDDRNAKLHE